MDECGTLSARGKCYECGHERMVDNYEQQVSHAGPWFDYWRLRCLAALGVFAVDDGRDGD